MIKYFLYIYFFNALKNSSVQSLDDFAENLAYITSRKEELDNIKKTIKNNMD